MKQGITPIDVENTFGKDEIIVSKTNLKGHITYVNDVFCRLAEMPEEEAIGAPHNVIRHPDMPRSIFYFLWQQIQSKKEIFAYVKNMAKSGKYYWVFAHVTPTIDADGNIVGFHSSRRAAPKNEIDLISKLYDEIRSVEKSYSNSKQGMEAGVDYIKNLLLDKGMTYDEFVWSVGD
ncbi:PAS domain-containing protein [Pseudemcibacter aquimaris]|uniref:PAS domain-containing protein n=1 Tax=Pseudemcibacter aquimaris TaxID=2857064 RepID=UPI002013844C|nr:PAS domain-containing protein [Pseudemcibacter aquimaris]MCC3861068.1 PAS domain-containing protein [Pseudemcibacter aquimaris]WDU59886.1 PAS domain-containing protein [Pseudemcibacter aquimaris]